MYACGYISERGKRGRGGYVCVCMHILCVCVLAESKVILSSIVSHLFDPVHCAFPIDWLALVDVIIKLST